MRAFLAAVLLVGSLGAFHAQVSTRLVGQNRLAFRGGGEGSVRFDSLILTFGTDPAAVITAEFRLTYGRSAEPQTGTIELLIAKGITNDRPGSPLVRRTLTRDELAALGASGFISVAKLNLELELVASQREALARRAQKWTRQ